MKTLRQYRQQLGWFMTCLMALWLPGPARSATSIWVVDAAGNWSTTGNWSPGAPTNSTGDVITLRNNITAARTITMDTAGTAGILNMGDLLGNSTFTLAGTNALTLNNGDSNSQINVLNGATQTISAPLTIAGTGLDANVYVGLLDLTGVVSSSGAGINKNGGGTLRLSNNSNVLAGPTITVNAGILEANTITAVAGTTSGILGTSALDLRNGQLNLRHNGNGNNTTVSFGNNVTVNGNSAINVNFATANTGVTVAMGTFNMGNQVLRVDGANSYALQFNDAATLATRSMLVVNSAPLTFAGATTAGVVNKQGGSTLTFSNASTTVDSLNLLTGAAQFSAAGTTITNDIIVNPNTRLGYSAANQIQGTNGDKIILTSTPNGLTGTGVTQGYGVIMGNSSFALGGTALTGVKSSVYGGVYSINTNAQAANIDAAALPAGWYIGAQQNTTLTGTVTGTGGILRLGTNATAATAITTGANGVIGGASGAVNVTVGSPLQRVTSINYGTGTLTMGNFSNSYTGVTTVFPGSTLNATSTTVQNPFGSNASMNVFGTAVISGNYTGTGPKISQTNFNIYNGGSLYFDATAVALTSTNLTAASSSVVNNVGGTFRFGGIIGVAANQTIADFNAYGQSTIDITRSATGGTAATTLTLTNLDRQNNAIIPFTRTTTTAAFGGAEGRVAISGVNGVAGTPTVTNGMISPWMLDATSATFLTYGANGIAPVTYTTAATPAALQAATTAQIVDLTAAALMTGNASVQALRVNGNFAITGGQTITIGTGSAAADGAGLIFTGLTGGQANAVNLVFGTGGNREAIIWQNAGQVASITGTVSAAGLALGGNAAGTFALNPAGTVNNNLGNVGLFTGPATINGAILRIDHQYALGGTSGQPYATGQSVNMYGGTLNMNAATLFPNAVTINANATIAPGNAGSMINSLTINALPVSVTGTDGTVASTGAVLTTSTNQFTIKGNLTMAAAGNINAGANIVVGGGLSGSGNLEKWGGSILGILGSSSGYSGAINVNQGTLQSNNGTASSNPFGTGALVVNPGGILRVSGNNLGNSSTTIKSDRISLGVLAMGYNGAVPSVTWTNVNGTLDGVVGIDVSGFSTVINQSTLGNGNTFLGSVLGGTLNAASVTPATGDVYRIGAGGGQLNLNSSALSTVAASLQVGAINSTVMADGVAYANGGGTLAINNTQAFTGGTTINGGGTLQIGIPGALNGTGTLTFNGQNNPQLTGISATLQPSSVLGVQSFLPTTVVNNAISLTGDATFNANTNNDLIVSGSISLAAQDNVTRFINSTSTSGRVYLTGGLTDGTGTGNGFVKTGAGVLSIDGANTYTGNTGIIGGTLALRSNTDIPTTSPQIIGQGGAIGVFDGDITLSNRQIWAVPGGTVAPYFINTADIGFNVGPSMTLTQSGGAIYGAGSVIKSGLGTMVLDGTNTNQWFNVTGGVLQFNSLAAAGDQSIAAVGQTVANAGTLRFNYTGGFARNIGAGGTGNAGVDVTAGNTITFLSGAQVLANNGGANAINKTGAGAAIFSQPTATTNVRTLTMLNGTLTHLQSGTNIPWDNGNVAVNVNLFGGTFGLEASTAAARTMTVANNAAAITNLNFGGGGRILFTPNGANSVSILDSASGFLRLVRSTQGVLLLETATGDLGVAATGVAGGRIVPDGLNFNGTVAAPTAALSSASVFTASLLKQSASGADFLGWNATNGLTPFASYAANFTGSTSTTVASITADPVFAAGTSTSVFGFKTTSDITGGTLRITSVGNTTATGRTEIGGVLINGSNSISSNLIFDAAAAGITQTTPTLAAGSGEGIVYVATSQNATLTGKVLAANFTKAGSGTLSLTSTANGIIGVTAVNNGTLRLGVGSAGSFTKLQTDLIPSNQGIVDLNGQTLNVDTLQSQTTMAGGTVTSSAANGKLNINGPTVVAAANAFRGQITGTMSLNKMGTGTAILGEFTNLYPDSGNNSYTGGTNVYGGSLIVRNPLNLGGAGGSTAGDVGLYGGTLNFNIDGANNNGKIIIGKSDQNYTSTQGINVNVRGSSTINFDRAAATVGNVIQIGNLNLGTATLTHSGANNYRLLVAGTTTVQGAWADILSGSNGPNGQIEIAGNLEGSGVLYKRSAGTTITDMRNVNISATGSTFSGSIIVQGGLGNELQISATTGTPIGTGTLMMQPGSRLRLGGNGSLGTGTLVADSLATSFPVISLDSSFNPTVLTSTNFGAAYGSALGISTPFFTTSLDMSAIGNGKAFLTSALNSEVSYVAPTLTAGAADQAVPGTPVWRVSGGESSLAFTGADNVLTGANFLMVGPNVNNLLVNGNTTGFANSVTFRNANDFSGGTQINRGQNVFLDTGAGALGTGAVEVIGSLQTGTGGSGFGMTAGFVNPATGNNYQTINLRPGGVIVINAIAGELAGGEGRWDDAGALSLNGGTFALVSANASALTQGGNNADIFEKIGAVTANKGGSIRVTRTLNSGTNTLEIASLTRGTADDRGTLQLRSTTGINGTNSATATGFMGIINPNNTTQTPFSFDRIVLADGGTSFGGLAGSTVNGTGNPSLTSGIAAPWIVDATNNTYVTYNPFNSNAQFGGVDTGFQPLVNASAGTVVGAATAPGLGQVSFSHVYNTAGTITDPGAGAVVDISTAQTLLTSQSLYAMRVGANVTGATGGSTITFAGGNTSFGGVLINAAATLGTQVTGSSTLPTTLAFGSREADLFVASGVTGVINSQITGSGGLVKFGNGTATLAGSNGSLTGDVIVNQGTLLLNTPVSATGTITASPVNGQTIILNGYGSADANSGTSGSTSQAFLQVTGLVAPTHNRDSLLPSTSTVTTTLNSLIKLRGDAVINNNNSAIQQRIGSLEVADLGTRTPILVSFNQGQITVAGTASFGANDTILNAGFSQTGHTIFDGVVSGVGTGRIIKTGNGMVDFNNAGNTFGTNGNVSLEVWGSTQATATSQVTSMVRSGTPFGVGDIKLLPGAAIRLFDVSNIANQKVSGQTDSLGMAGLNVSFNATTAQIAGLVTTGAPTDGKLNLTSSTNNILGLGLDAGLQYNAINLASLETGLGGGRVWLGASAGTTTYFAPTLTPGAGGYRFGAGGDQGSLVLGAFAFENVLTGNNSVTFGALSGPLGPQSIALVNGNMSTTTGVILRSRNNYTGDTIFTRGVGVTVNNNFAFGTSKLVFAHLDNTNSIIRTDGNQAQVSLSNDVELLGDLRWQGDAANREFVLRGNVNIAPGGVAGTHTIDANTNGTWMGINGVISGAGSSLIKNGSQGLILNGLNTYSGQTTISGGTLVLGTNVLPNQNGALGNSDTPVLFNATGANLFLGGQVTVGRDIYSSIAANATSSIVANTLYRAEVSGGIVTVPSGTGFTVLQSVARTTLGTLDITGSITGAGALQIGESAAPATGGGQNAGAVRLLNNVNGFSTNTFTGGITLQNARLVVGADSYWTGTTAAPVIISGPLGTGTLTFGSGASDNTNDRVGSIGSNGVNVTLPNSLALTMAGSDRTLTASFEGRGNLNFNRTGYNISIGDGTSTTAARNRTINVTTQQGVVTIAGNLAASGTTGSIPVKAGSGVLVYTGQNNAGGLVNTLDKYRASWDINQGTLVIAGSNPEAALGGTIVGELSDIRLTGGTLSLASTFQTDHQFILTGNSGINVTQGNTFTLRGIDAATTTTNAITGAFGITKSGLGTLVLNPATIGSTTAAPGLAGVSSVTNLTIGGVNPLNGSATSGVSNALNAAVTTNTGGNPFVAANGTVVVNGGLLGITNTSATASTINLGATSTLNYGGGGYIYVRAPSSGINTLQTQTFAAAASTKGTLVVMGDNIANFGALGTPSQRFVIGGTLPTITNNTLAVPSVVIRNAATGSDANFATALVTTGFQTHGNAGQTNLTTTAPTLIGDISAASTLGAAAFELYALRTSANVDATTAGDTLRLINGGLIINGTTAPVIGGNGTALNLRFGTAAAAADAYVYVKEGLTGTATIAATMSSNDFIKFGPGNLLLSGTGSTMVPNTALRSIFVQEGVLSFAGDTSVPTGGANTNGRVNVVVNDAGTLNLNGQSLTIGALSGSGFVINNGATSTLTTNVGLNSAPSFTGQIQNGTGTLALEKSGVGTLTIATPLAISDTWGRNTYSGGTTINAGQIINANPIALVTTASSNGQITVNNSMGLGTGDITLKGGILAIGNPVNIETRFGQAAFQFGPGSGSNVVIAATNNFGQANLTSILNGPGTPAAAVIGNLTVNSAGFGFSGGAQAQASFGILVGGTTTLTQANTTIAGTGSISFGGAINTPGGTGTITKSGAGSIFLYNNEVTSTVGAWNIQGGVLEARGANGMTNTLSNGATLTLNDAVFNTRYDGDGTSIMQVLTTSQSNNVVFGSTALVSSNNFIGSRNVTINHDRLATGSQQINVGASWKTIVMGDMTFGGALGSPFATFTTAAANNTNRYSHQYGNVSAMKDIYFSQGNEVTLTGTLSGLGGGQQSQGGTFYKQGSSLYVNGDSAATWKGGFVNATGTTFFGTFQGNVYTPNETNATITSGNILIQPGSAIQYNTTGNVPSGWTGTTDLRAHNLSYGILRMAADAPLTSFNVRVGSLGGPQDTSRYLWSSGAGFDGQARNAGGSFLALNTIYTQNLDQARIGDGMGFIGSSTNGLGLNGHYNGTALGVGAANTYRLGGSNTLFVGSNGNTNVLTDVGPSTPANLVVGALFAGVQVDNINGGNGRGVLALMADQNYTGTTLVNRGSTLEFRGTLKSTSFESFGLLTAGGLGGTFVNTAQTANLGTVALRSGAEIRFDYSTGVLPAALTEGTGGQGRWLDTAPIALDSSTLRLNGNRAYEVVESAGAVTGSGGNTIQVARDYSGRTATLNLASLAQNVDVGSISGNNGTFNIRPNNTAQLGSDERLKITGTAPVTTNGMVSPWMFNNLDLHFLTYTAENGFVNAGFGRTVAAQTLAANLDASTDRSLVSGAVVINNGITLDTYALRLDADITATTPGGANGATVQVRSGGIAMNNGAARTLAPHRIVAGDGVTPTDLYFWGQSTAASVVIGDLANANFTGQFVNTKNVIVNTAQNFELQTSQQAWTGNTIVNSGSVVLRTAATTGTFSPAGLTGSEVLMNTNGGSIFLRAAGNVTFTNGIVLGANNPYTVLNYDRDGATASNNTITMTGGITFLGSPGEQGQTLRFQNANDFDTTLTGTVNLGPDGNYATLFQNNDNGTNTVILSGKITGNGGKTAVLIKGGNGTIDLANVTNGANDWKGGLNIGGGGITVRGTTAATGITTPGVLANGGLGEGAVTLYPATLNIRYDGAGATYDRISAGNTAASVSLIVNGSSTVTLGQQTAASTNKLISFKDLSIGNSTLTYTTANGYALDIFGQTNLVGNPVLNHSGDMILNGAINDGGANLYMIKQSTGSLWINDANTNYAGGVIVNAGAIRFGNYNGGANGAGASTSATLGTGSIRLNPGAALHLEASTNVTGTGQINMVSNSVANSVLALRGSSGIDQTYLAAKLSSTSNGVLALENAITYSSALTMSSLGAGNMFLGAANLNGVTANGTYSATTLGAGSGNTYRLGGGGGTLTLDAAATTTGALTGASNKVLIGAAGINGGGTVIFSDVHDYAGGTIINRSSNVTNLLRVDTAATATAGPLGAPAASVDIFGHLQVAGGTAGTLLANGSTTNNAYTVVTHAGAVLQLDSSGNTATATMTNKWGDSAAMTLNSSVLRVNGPGFVGNLAAVETIGALTIAGGSQIDLQRAITNSQVAVTAASVARSGSGTLTITAQGTGQIGIAAGNNSSRLVATSAPTVTNGMVPAWIINGTDNQFVTHGANGFANATLTNSTATFPLTTTATSLINVDAASTMQADASVYALRMNANLSSGTGQYNTITFGGTGANVGGLLFSTNATAAVNLRFGSGGANEALIYNANNTTGQISGDITAGSITKFGTGILQINKDQTEAARGAGNGLAANWVINQGQLNLQTFGGAGTGTITLAGGLGNNAAGAAGTVQNNNVVTLALNANTGSMLQGAYSFGQINVNDVGRISFDPGGDDRTVAIGNVDINSSDTTGLVPARLRVDPGVANGQNRSRAILMANVLSVSGTGSSIIDVNMTGGGTLTGFNGNTGITAGMSVASLANGNVATLGVNKMGNGYLFVRGDSSSTFNGVVTIDQGAVQVNHNGSLGTGAVNVNRYGVLDVNVAGYAATNSGINYAAGSAERWSIDGARSGQTLSLGAGTLQVNADQFTATGTTVNLNGGGIEGWLRGDDFIDASSGVVFRTLGTGVSVNLAGNSFIGQNITESAGGIDTGRFPNGMNPLGNNTRGVILEIKGVISGVGGLTKQGFDTVILSGANTFSGGTNVTQGTLRLGVNDALSTTGDLSTSGTGVLDLYGSNQTVRQLTSNTVTTPGITSGFITNSATEIKTLSVGNSSTGSMIYNGVIQNNVALTLNTSAAGHVLSLRNSNTYLGGTTVTNGWLEAANTIGSATGSGLVTVNSGGRLAGAGFITGRTVLNSGGIIEPGSVNSVGPVSNGGVLSVGGLTINGGSLVFGLTTPTSLADDLIRITSADPSGSVGALNLVGALSGLTINNLGGFGNGTYTLIDYNVPGATLTGSFATTFGSVLNPTSPVPGKFLTVVNNTSQNRIDLLVQSNTTALWTGAEDQKWNLLTHAAPKNWKDLGGAQADYSEGLDVTFDNTATGFLPAIDGVVKPLSVTFNNSTTYTLSQANGAGDKISNNSVTGITGDTDGSTAVITNMSSTSGLTVGMTIAGAGIPANATIASVDSATQITISVNTTSANTGTGLTGTTAPSLVKNGTGTVILNTPDNDFTGGSTLNSGTIRLGASTTVTAGVLDKGPLGTGTVNLNGGTIQDDNTTRTLANSVIIGGDVTFSSTGSGSVIFSNEVSGNSTTLTPASTTLTVNNTTTFQQPVTGSGKALTKAGSGTLIFTAANTYSGGTTVNAGTLQVDGTGSLASASNLTVGGSGTTTFAQASQILGTIANAGTLTLNGGSAQALTATTLNGAGDLNLGANSGTVLTVTNGNYTGTIDQTGALTKTGAGADNLTLTNANSTYSEGTNLNGGALSLGASSIVSGGAIASGPIGTGTLTLAAGTAISTVTADQSIANAVTINGSFSRSGNNLTVDGTALTVPTVITIATTTPTITVGSGISDTYTSTVTDSAGTFGLTKAGLGSLYLNNANNSYSGVTTINAGILSVNSLETQTSLAGTNTDSLGDSSNAEANLVINGGTLQYLGAATTTDRDFTIGASGATLDASGTGAVVFNDTTAVGGTGNRNLALTGTNAGDNTLSSILGLGTGTLTKNGPGTWLLNQAASTFTGATTINGGTLKVTTLANGGANSSIGAAAVAATNLSINNGATLQWIGTTTQSTNRLFQVTTNGILDASGTGGAVVNFTGTGTITTATGNGNTTLTITGTGGTSTTPNTLAGLIADNGTGTTNVVKNGTGVWGLTSSTSSYNGTTTINAGVLAVTKLADGLLASSIGDSSNSAANLVINGATLRYVGAGDTSNRSFTVGTSGATIDASGTGILSLGGGGAPVLSGTNTARTVTLTGSNVGDNVMNLTFANNGTGATAITKAGDGTWVMQVVNTYTGATTVTNGTLKLGVNNAINSGSSVTVAASTASDTATLNLNDRTLTLSNATAALTLGGAANATANVTTGAAATGVLTLGGNVVYDATSNPGTATISAGTTGSGIAMTAARTFTINNSTNTTTELLVTAPISGTAGAVIKAGDGTMALNATNTYTGATTVNAGVLQVGVAGVGTTGAGATTVNSTGTLAGTGTVSAAATIASGGTIAPGDLSGSSIGTINLGGGLTIQNSASASLGITTGNSLGVSDKSAVVAALAGGTYTGIEAAIGLTNLNTYNTGIGAGASYDLINVTGSFSMANATFTVNDQSYISGGSPQIGHIFNLIDWTTVGTFTGFNVGTGLVLPDLSSLGLGWDTTAFTSHGIIVVVPEPSRAILLLLGLLGLMMRRRRQTV